MNEKLMNYLDGIFSPYEDLHTVKELKEELNVDLKEKLSDLKLQGYNDETAYRMTIDSIGDIKEIVESISVKIGIKHFSDIQSIAMVGEKKWQHGMACVSPLISIKVLSCPSFLQPILG